MKLIFLTLISSLFFSSLFSAPFSGPWGADSKLVSQSQLKCQSLNAKQPKLTAGQKSCRAMIRFFQVYISPIDGPRSSFYPTSSQYALEAIQKFGIFQGISMGCDRLMRENGEMWVYKTTERFGPLRKLDPIR